MLFKRMWRVIKLDKNIYNEILQDPYSGAQAVTIVILATFASVVGFLGSFAAGNIFKSGTYSDAVFYALVFMPVLWLVQGGLAYVFSRVSNSASGRQVTAGQLRTVIAYSAAPAVALVFAGIPLVGALIALMVVIWLVVTMSNALTLTMQISFSRALMFVFPGFALRFVLAL
ncbi:MAG: hypothetical protein FJ039_02520 [Chloroflexi bacterium]|nr:hypothetical protein [Chloroflexota bacterium]